MLKRKTNIFVTILFIFVVFMLIGTTNVNATTVEIGKAAKSGIIDKDPQVISFAETEVVKTYGDDSYTKTATRTEGNGNVTYTSTDTNVATVDGETGKVTILKVGTTKIKATASETDGYAEATAEYTLTINPKTITPTVSAIADQTYFRS